MRLNNKNILIPLIVIAVIASMVVPLPVWLLDFLLAGNLVLSVILLVSAFTVTDILKLSSFPTLVLLTTLYRLSLNISTTRLLLSEGYIGQVITTLSHAMTNGNITVGFVVFVVISIIQFLVIAKGSERVAEVSARFTLDAMPGRQMSIDAELRAGALSVEEAQIRRRDLQRESQFYGALDGAMKFVKGDAIAGMLIAVVNLIGGILVGVLVNGDSFAAAVELYAFYTIGDGLVAQVPAVLNALSAGVIVTRVRGDGANTLAMDIGEQLLQSPGIQVSIAIGCFGLAFLPGMPTLSFIIIGAGLLGGAFFKTRAVLRIQRGLASEQAHGPTIPDIIEIIVPRELSQDVVKLKSFCDCLEIERENLFESTGVILSRPQVNAGSEEGTLVIKLRGVEVGRIDIGNREDSDMVGECFVLIRTLLSEIIDDKCTSLLLSYQEMHNAELVSAIVPAVVSVTDLTVILRTLIEEGVSVRNLDTILQAIGEFAPKIGKDRMLIEEIRIRLGRFISLRHFGVSGKRQVVGVSSKFEFRCSTLEREVGVLSFGEVQALNYFLATWCQQGGEVVALVVCRTARAFLREYVKGLGFDLPVIAREEIKTAAIIETVARFEPDDLMRIAEVEGNSNVVMEDRTLN
jgi:type III secretion protein V